MESPTTKPSEGQPIRRPPVHEKENWHVFPAVDRESDLQVGANGDRPFDTSGFSLTLGKLIGKVPPSVWQANAVVPQHRRKAHLYWGLLLVGYAIYIGLVSDQLYHFERNKKNEEGTSPQKKGLHCLLSSTFIPPPGVTPPPLIISSPERFITLVFSLIPGALLLSHAAGRVMFVCPLFLWLFRPYHMCILGPFL